MTAEQFAAMQGFKSDPMHFIGYVVLTLVFLVICWLIGRSARPLGTILIVWGVLVQILVLGYGFISVPAVIFLAPAIMKVGFVLVLGGVACSVLDALPKSIRSNEVDHV